MKLYQELAHLAIAHDRGVDRGRVEERIRRLVREHMPSGAGFDNGCTLDVERSTACQIVFHTSFHHMDEHGSYDGWTEHTVTVVATLVDDLKVMVSGSNRNDIRPYIRDVFADALVQEVLS